MNTKSNGKSRNKPNFGMCLCFTFLISVVHCCSISNVVAAQQGDVPFWLPPDGSNAVHQIARNDEYFSIKIQAAYAYYKSSFLENIKKLVIASQASVIQEGKTIDSAAVNKTWQKLDPTGDFIGINDHIMQGAPATPTGVSITMKYRGIGNDRFKGIFDILADPTVKTAMNLSPATSAAVGAITPIVQKMLASPYTDADPRQILDIGTSFTLYPSTESNKVDSLRAGFLVVLSSRGKNGPDLSDLLNLKVDELRMSPRLTGIERYAGGKWVSVSDYSYVVFAVVASDVRGQDQSSPWFKKYRDGVDTARNDLLSGKSLADVKKAAIAAWRDGNTLLAADPGYIDSEKQGVQSYWLKKVEDALKTTSLVDASIDAASLGVTNNFRAQSDTYTAQVLNQFIVPPDTTDEKDQDAAKKLASNLRQLSLDPTSIKAQFQNIADAASSGIDNPNTLLLTLMNGIDAYSKAGVPLDIGAGLADSSLGTALAKAGVAGGTPNKEISATAQQKIMSFQGGYAVILALRKAGYTLER